MLYKLDILKIESFIEQRSPSICGVFYQSLLFGIM